MEKPYLFQSFDEYYQATRSGMVALNQDFHVFRYSDLNPGVVTKMQLFRLSFYQFNICKASESLIRISGTSELSKEMQLIIFTPGKLSEWEKLGAWEGYIIFVKESFIRLNSENLNARLMYHFLRTDKHPITDLTNEEYLQLAELCEKMIYESENLRKENIFVIEHYLQILLVHIKRIQERNQKLLTETNREYSSTQLDIHNKFVSLVEKTFLETKTVGLFASQLNITAGYLNECVKSVSGKSSKEIIQQVILLEAKSLLKQTSVPVKEIAFKLNFQDYSHFVKFFKAATGQSPAAFRDSP